MIMRFTYVCGHAGEVVFTELAHGWHAQERILLSERASLCPPCTVRSPQHRPRVAHYAWSPS